MPRHFKIHELLSREELDALEAFTREPGRTIDEIETWLGARGCVTGNRGGVSRGAVHAWRTSFLVEDKFRASSDLARQIMTATAGKDAVSLSDAATSQLGQVIFERSVAMQIDGETDTRAITNMTAALKNLVTGKRHIEDLREEMKTRQTLALSEAEKIARGGASTDAVIAKVRDILGIAQEA